MDTLIRGFREHAAQGTAGSQLITLKTGREVPAPRTVSTLYSQTSYGSSLSIRVFQFQSENSDTIRPATLCPRTDGWQWQLPASQGKPAGAPCLSIKGGHTSLNLHRTPTLWGSAWRYHEESLRAGENELHRDCTQQSQAGQPWGQSPEPCNGQATQKRGWMRS